MMPVRLPVLVTGAGGFVGARLVRHLEKWGYPVRAAVRHAGAPTSSQTETVVLGEMTAATDWTEALGGIDCIIHCAARAHVLRDEHHDPEAAFMESNARLTEQLAIQTAKAGVRRLVFVSSIGVNGQETHGSAFRHDDTPAPVTAYARSKLAAEQALLNIDSKSDLEVVRIRPPLVRGPNAKGNLQVLERAILKGLPLPLGSVRRNRRDFVSIDTLCHLLELCIRHPDAAGQVFLVSDGKALSTAELIEDIGRNIGKSARLLPFPPSLLSLGLSLAGRSHMASQLLGDLEIDIGHTQKVLDWSPQTSLLSQTQDRNLAIDRPEA